MFFINRKKNGVCFVRQWGRQFPHRRIHGHQNGQQKVWARGGKQQQAGSPRCLWHNVTKDGHQRRSCCPPGCPSNSCQSWLFIVRYWPIGPALLISKQSHLTLSQLFFLPDYSRAWNPAKALFLFFIFRHRSHVLHAVKATGSLQYEQVYD